MNDFLFRNTSLFEFSSQWPLLLTAAAFAGTFYSVVQAMYALRAKRRAYNELRRMATTDEVLRGIIAHARDHRLNMEEVALAQEEILKIIEHLSPRDQKFIESGLTQRNPAGAAAYIRQILVDDTPRHAA